MSIILASEQAAAEAAQAKPAESTPAASDQSPSAPVAETEQKEAPESDTEATESTEGDPEAETPEEGEKAEGKEEDSPEGEQKPKRKSGVQKRVDKLNARISAAQQEAEYWKREALKSANAPKPEDPAAKPAPKADAGKPMPDAFDTHAEYVEALTDWKVEQKQKERDEREAKRGLETEQNQLVQKYVERRDAFAEKTPDFYEALSDVEDIRVSPAVSDIILRSENGPELAYALAKDREEYARICKLPPLSAAREIGKLESRLSAKASEEKTPEPKKITKAPAPLAPVGTGGKGSAPKSIYDPNISQREYEAIRAKQRAARSG